MRHVARGAMLLAAALAISTSTAIAQSAAINEVQYSIRGMEFVGPDVIPAGMTTISVTNEADGPDLFALISLSGGRGLDEFFATMEMLFTGDLLVVPDWIQLYGGSPIATDESRSYTIFLSPGTYYLLSVEGDDEGPYAARGRLLPITVEAPTVDASVDITLDDYEFVIDGTLVAGMQVVRVHNAANQPHELLMLPLPPGVSLEMMLMADPEEGGEDAGDDDVGAVQGIWALNPGETAYVTVNLQSGTYGIVCFIPDADGPHAFQGMAVEVTVD